MLEFYNDSADDEYVVAVIYTLILLAFPLTHTISVQSQSCAINAYST